MKNQIVNGKGQIVGSHGSGELVNWELRGSFKVAGSIELHRRIDGVASGEPLVEGVDFVKGTPKKFEGGWASLPLLKMWEAKQPAHAAGAVDNRTLTVSEVENLLGFKLTKTQKAQLNS